MQSTLVASDTIISFQLFVQTFGSLDLAANNFKLI